MKIECRECHKGEDEVRLQKCPICFKHFCEEHAADQGGVRFCSKSCAQYFFFGDPDD